MKFLQKGLEILESLAHSWLPLLDKRSSGTFSKLTFKKLTHLPNGLPGTLTVNCFYHDTSSLLAHTKY